MRLIVRFRDRIDPRWISILLVLVISASSSTYQAQACDTSTCKFNEHKRCYPTQVLTQANEVLTCRCLKGLYEMNGVCLGVVRYDFTIQLQIVPAFVNQRLSEERIKTLVSREKEILSPGASVKDFNQQ